MVQLTCGKGQMDEAGGQVGRPRGRGMMVASCRKPGGPGDGEGRDRFELSQESVMLRPVTGWVWRWGGGALVAAGGGRQCIKNASGPLV